MVLRITRWHGFQHALLGAAVVLGSSTAFGQQVPTTLNDFFGPGTQPNGLTDVLLTGDRCDSCHSGYGQTNAEPFGPWAASLMGQAGRDPLAFATIVIAEQDAAFAGDLCLRCHTPVGWLEGRSVPTDGSGLIAKDFEGVNCQLCHRLVDHNYEVGISPSADQAIIAGLAVAPQSPHSGHMIVDPLDFRRGPYDLGGFNRHDWYESPFHRESDICATCHDVSNPVFSRQPDGTYALNALDTPHETHNKYDQFPVERTYSEWSMSAFAQGPIEMGGRFGGNITAVSSCQDCHMPDTTGHGCKQEQNNPPRTDLPTHHFVGGNTWLIKAVRAMYPDAETFLTEARAQESIARSIALLQAASDMELSQVDDQLKVRIINQSGHKLPTGYPEGRRMWINVQFLDATDQLITEHGFYNFETATLHGDDTTVIEAKLGVDAAISAATGVPEGESFHFALNNVRIKDNRIPPRGFTNAAFESVQADPVDATYADGQYWLDSLYPIPPGAEEAHVTVYYQTASREYIEFLRDNNETNSLGDELYALWADPLIGNKGAPVEMDSGEIDLIPPADCSGDANGDQQVNITDLNLVVGNFGSSGAPGLSGDLNDDGEVNITDLNLVLGNFGNDCSA